MSQTTKQVLREDMASLKKQHSKDIQSDFSQLICRKLEENELFLNASCVALYYAIPGEVETASFIEKWYRKKNILLPVIQGEDLLFIPYTGKDCLKKGVFNIPEPSPDISKAVNPEEIDLIIVPGVAFDRELNRMGRGKGFYDRLLASTKAPRVGICFSFQLLDKVPVEPHDTPMDLIFTEKETISGFDING